MTPTDSARADSVSLDFAEVQCNHCEISDPEYSLVDVSAFRRDIVCVADSLRRLADDAPPASRLLHGLAPSQVVIGGMGSSGFAADDAARRLRQRGLDARSERPSCGTPGAPTVRTLYVAVSASGRTPETLAAFEQHRGTSRTLAVTQDASSPLVSAADYALVLPAAAGESGTAVHQFQLVVAALQLLEAAVGGADHATGMTWRRAADSLDALIDGAAAWTPAATELFIDRPVFTIADQTRLASAKQTALLVREVARSLADASDFAEWGHSDVYLSARPGYAALAFGTSPWTGEFVRWMGARNRPVVSVGVPIAGIAPAVSIRFADDDVPAVAALVEATVGALLAAALADEVDATDPTRVLRGLRA